MTFNWILGKSREFGGLARYTYGLLLLLAISCPSCVANQPDRRVLIRDITTIEGVRDNMLVGYGLVVGLRGTGDRQQTIFTVQTLANAMQKMGVLISPNTVVVKNVAAVFITASLPPFSRPGSRLDVTVSSIGDAQSLEGGVLLMSALHGPDGPVYAEAQGPLVLGGYSAGTGANRKDVNAANVAIIPQGAIVERDASVDLSGFKTVSLLLRNPDFTTATKIAETVNQEFNRPVATAVDSARVDISVAQTSSLSVSSLISRLQSLVLSVHVPAKIVINERTGTIVMGGDVKLSAVSVIHGNLTIDVATTYDVSATPLPGVEGLSGESQLVAVPNRALRAGETSTQSIQMDEGANVDELVKGLHAIGTTAHDIVAILQAIRAEGGMQAELEVQ
jgi:flagellar P-ring protein precursor FlgI